MRWISLILITCLLVLGLFGCHGRDVKITPTQPIADNENKPPADNITWISPGRVNIGKYYGGAQAEANIMIHNGSDNEIVFSIAYEDAEMVTDGYVRAPDEAENWVQITDASPILRARETREVLIVLAMPEEIIDIPPRWEFWISIAESNVNSVIQTALASRWLVDMR